MSLRGFCANNESPTLVNSLAPDWMLIGWGSWLANLNNTYNGKKWAIALYDQDTTYPINPVTYAAISQHPSFDHKYIILREPDLSGKTVQESADIANAQIDLITTLDPQAGICLSLGSVLNPVYKDNSYGSQLFSLIIKKRFIDYFGFTYYPHHTLQYEKYVNKTYEWVQANYPARAIWICEVGQVTGAPIYPAWNMSYMKAASESKVARWAWYVEQQIIGTTAEGYDCLLDLQGNKTALGQEF